MLDDTEGKAADSHTHAEPETDGSASWAAVAKNIKLAAGAVAFIAAMAAVAQLFTRSRLAVVIFAVGGSAGILLIAIIGARLSEYVKRKIKLPVWVALTAPIACVAIGMILLVWLSPNRPDQPPVPGLVPPKVSAIPRLLAEAEVKLASSQRETQLSGILELQNLMQADPADQPAVINALCAFVSRNSPASPSGNDLTVSPDIRAALNVLIDRNPAHDGGAKISLDNTNLTGANLSGADFANASISGDNGADFTNANLANVNLSGADVANSYFGGANLAGTNLTDADLSNASFYQTRLCSSSGQKIYRSANYICSE